LFLCRENENDNPLIRSDSDLTDFQQFLQKGLKIMNISISDDQALLFSTHAEELIKWNRKINLTAIKQPLDIAEKHFIDCIAASAFIKIRKNKTSVLDIGSGGGFPGVPLKIMNPDFRVMMVDSSRKKINFLKHVIRRLDLKDIDAVHARVQDLHENSLYKNRFDAVTSRAFTNLADFITLAAPFLNRQGSVYAMKGKKIDEEITLASNLLENYSTHTYHYSLPFENALRSVLRLNQKRVED